jgi:hypothetical protein
MVSAFSSAAAAAVTLGANDNASASCLTAFSREASSALSEGSAAAAADGAVHGGELGATALEGQMHGGKRSNSLVSVS